MEAASAVMKRVPTTRQSSAESCPVIMAALHTWMDVIGCCKSAGGRAVMANYYEECSESPVHSMNCCNMFCFFFCYLIRLEADGF